MRLDLRAGGWACVGGTAARGQAFLNGELLSAWELATRFDGVDRDRSSVAALAADLEGFYGAIVTDGVLVPDEGIALRSRDVTTTHLIADGVRTIPLYYATDGSAVADNGRWIRDRLGASRDPVAESEFMLARYVTGPETIWRGVAATTPGTVVHVGTDGVESDGANRHRYRDYWPADGAENHAARLRAGFEAALDRTGRVAGDRPVAVPLSGGYDSRLLAAGMAARDREVVAFTFGRPGHPDVEVSREVADRLGVRWEFVEYDHDRWCEWYHGEAGRGYRRRAFGGDALPFLAAWPAVRTLLEDGRVPQEALFCPGHTVATPSERLPPFADGFSEPEAGETDHDDDAVDPMVEALVEYVLERHYSLWEWDDDAFRAAAAARIREGLLGGRPPGSVDGPAALAAAYERWEWAGRMSTFTAGDLRGYEELGVDWWLPLWDPAYVRAWATVPLVDRRGKRAQKSLAAEYYREAAAVPESRVRLTDRTLLPADRHLSLVRHTPARQFTHRGGRWGPRFLAPRSAWGERGSHPLAWYGAVDPDLFDRLPPFESFYSLRTLAATGRLDLQDAEAPIPDGRRLDLPTAGW